MAWQIDRPTPLVDAPGACQKGSKTRCAVGGRDAGALVLDGQLDHAVVGGRAATVMVEPGGEWRAAFSSRLVTTWSSWE